MLSGSLCTYAPISLLIGGGSSWLICLIDLIEEAKGYIKVLSRRSAGPSWLADLSKICCNLLLLSA